MLWLAAPFPSSLKCTYQMHPVPNTYYNFEALVQWMGLDVVTFPGLFLEPPPGVGNPSPPCLWGLTLEIVCDLMSLMGRQLPRGLDQGRLADLAGEAAFPRARAPFGRLARLYAVAMRGRCTLTKDYIKAASVLGIATVSAAYVASTRLALAMEAA